MSFSLDGVVPWGRNYTEYTAMFDLSRHDLSKRILSCADGPASFNAEAYQRGQQVVSCDPLYAMNRDDIQQQIVSAYDPVIDGMRRNRDEFNWTMLHPSPDTVGQMRMAAMQHFLFDYVDGQEQQRYIEASLPNLPFEDNAFELAVCSHFLFLYSEQFDAPFHTRAIFEMLRVANEVRIFPLVALGGKPSPHVTPVTADLQAKGYQVYEQAVDYEFVKGASRMLVITQV